MPRTSHLLEFFNRIVYSLLNLALFLSPTTFQSLHKCFRAWWQYSNKIGEREWFVELESSLNIDVKQWNFLLWLNFVNLSFCGSIHVAMHLRPLNEFIIINHLFESFLLYEVVVNPIYFALSRCSSSAWDREPKFFRVFFCQMFHECAFSSTWRSCNN